MRTLIYYISIRNYLNLFSPGLHGFNVLYTETQGGKTGKCYLFIDEVQDIMSFEKALRGLLADGGYDIYCTGSNARMAIGGN